jgi:cell division protein FtsN
VLQLAAFDDENEAKDFKSDQRAFASARILSPYKKGSRKHYYIVVMGPFEDKAQADRFMQKNPLYSRGWLRSGKSVKAQFERPSDDR